MSILAQIGTTIATGAQTTAVGLTADLTNWIIEKCKTGAKKKDMEEINTQDGALFNILVFQRLALIDMTLVSRGTSGTAAQAVSDFPDGDKCTLTGLTAYLVESVDIENSKSAVRVNVSLRNIGI